MATTLSEEIDPPTMDKMLEGCKAQEDASENDANSGTGREKRSRQKKPGQNQSMATRQSKRLKKKTEDGIENKNTLSGADTVMQETGQ